MTNINIGNETHQKWREFYETFPKLKYPSLRNFTEQKLLEIMEQSQLPTEK